MVWIKESSSHIQASSTEFCRFGKLIRDVCEAQSRYRLPSLFRGLLTSSNIRKTVLTYLVKKKIECSFLGCIFLENT